MNGWSGGNGGVTIRWLKELRGLDSVWVQSGYNLDIIWILVVVVSGIARNARVEAKGKSLISQ